MTHSETCVLVTLSTATSLWEYVNNWITFHALVKFQSQCVLIQNYQTHVKLLHTGKLVCAFFPSFNMYVTH
jgi:hypothetical protein